MSNLTNPSLTVIYGRISCNLQKNSQSANKKKSKIKGKLFKNVAYTVAFITVMKPAGREEGGWS